MMKSDEERPTEGVDEVVSEGTHVPGGDVSGEAQAEEAAEPSTDAFEGLAPDLRAAIEDRGFTGLTAVQRAILDGHTETGVTIMEMEAGLDTGAMISKVRTPIEPADNAQTLHDRLAELGATLLIETMPGYVAGEISPEPQDDSQATHAAKITRDMGRVDWSKTATEIWNQARAFTPWPGVFTHLNGKLLKLLEVEPTDTTGLAPGALGQADADGILVGCGGGALRIKRLQKEGGKRLAADAFLAGNPLQAGTVLG